MLTLTFDPNLKEKVDKHSNWINSKKKKLVIPETTNMLKIINNSGS